MMLELSSPAITEAARRVWLGVSGGASAPGEVGAIAERTLVTLRVNLRRWVGAEGYRALMDRAVGATVTDHPVLDGLACHEEDPPATAAHLDAHGSEAIGAAFVALVAMLTQVLGRIIGDGMAMQLLEQLVAVHPQGVTTVPHQGGPRNE